MKTPFVPAVERACPANWKEMTGNHKIRFCQHCQLHVHNLSAMSREEQIDLLTPNTERKCISYVAPSHARKVDITTWIASQSQIRPWFSRWAAAIVAAFVSLFFSSCRTMGPPMIAPPPDGKNPVTTGQSMSATEGN